MNLIPLPACQGNSLWLLHDGQRALVVDLGDAGPVDLFPGNGLQLEAILVTRLPQPAEGDRVEVLESTFSKLEFATAVAPSSGQLIHSRQQCEPRRSRGEPCLPSAIAPERSTNPFLRTGQPAVAQAAQAPAPADPADPVAMFATLRPWKNEFR